jgi:hypothetical protein
MVVRYVDLMTIGTSIKVKGRGQSRTAIADAVCFKSSNRTQNAFLRLQVVQSHYHNSLLEFKPGLWPTADWAPSFGLFGAQLSMKWRAEWSCSSTVSGGCFWNLLDSNESLLTVIHLARTGHSCPAAEDVFTTVERIRNEKRERQSVWESNVLWVRERWTRESDKNCEE